MKKYNAVIIGCGKIGALYDIENDLILTHAKGYYLSDNINLKFVIDVDKSVAVKVSKKYNCDYKLDYKDIDYKEIDIVSICTPTEFHFEILSERFFNCYIILSKELSINHHIKEKQICFCHHINIKISKNSFNDTCLVISFDILC